jgi:hypothetical protein
VSWPAPRQVVRVGPEVTNALVRMLNHQLAARDTEMPQPRSRVGGRHLSPVHPQPCIKDDKRGGEWLRICHRARQLAQSMPSHSTQTPKFRLGQKTPSANHSAPTTQAAPPPKRERPFTPSPPRKKPRTHDSPSNQKRDLRRRIQYLRESRQPMSLRAKQEQLCLVKSKEVQQAQFVNKGRNRRNAEHTSTVKYRNHMDEPGPSTYGRHTRETHLCSRCYKLGHYGGNCPVAEVRQQPATAGEPAPNLSRPTAILPQGQPLALDRPRGPHIGQVGWDNE